MNDRCLICGAHAEFLCDAVIGIEPVLDSDGSATDKISLSSRQWTCDAPVCRDHSTRVGHICWDSIDHCKYHIDYPDRRITDIIIPEDGIDRKRRNIHAAMRRARMIISAAVGHEANSD